MQKVSFGHLFSTDTLMILLADSKNPDQTAWMRSLISAFTIRICAKTQCPLNARISLHPIIMRICRWMWPELMYITHVIIRCVDWRTVYTLNIGTPYVLTILVYKYLETFRFSFYITAAGVHSVPCGGRNMSPRSSSYPASILYKSTAGRYRPVSYPDVWLHWNLTTV